MPVRFEDFDFRNEGVGGWQLEGPWDQLFAEHTTTTGTTTTTPTQTSIVTGIDPSEIHKALYGKVIPLFSLGDSSTGGGLVRIGTAGLIWGPYFSGGAEARLASFAVSFGFPANVTGTRRVYEIALDGKVAWEKPAGDAAGTLDAAGFLGDPFTVRFYGGTQTQDADPLESAMFGAEAVAYRPQVMLWFENLPVTQFDNKVPFVSAKIGDVTGGATAGDGVNLGTCLEAIAYSPWIECDSSSFETTGVADIVQGMILTEDQSFLDLLKVTARVYRTLDIIQTDMLRVKDRGSIVSPDLVLERDHVVADAGVQYFRQEEASVPRELELITIDPDADYVFMPFKVARPLAPVPVTSSVAKETITLPVVIGATTRASLVTYAKYQEDNARKRIALRAMLYGYALEPGDLFRLRDIADGFDNGEVWKVTETSHGANYINEIIGEAILKCAIAFTDTDTDFASVVMLIHGESDSPGIDSSAYNEDVAFNANAQMSTSVKKFGAASFYFDGTSDFVAVGGSFSTSPQYNFSPTNTSPYTVELWVNIENILRGVNQILICRTSFAQKGWVLYNPADSTELTYATSSNTSSFTATITTSGADLEQLRWYHIAVDKDSTGKVRIYVDGVMRGSNTPADSVIYASLSYPIVLGADAAGVNALQGNIDDVRITTVSRYGDAYGDTGFDPPTEQFPDNAP